MTKEDDSALQPQEYNNVLHHADLLLREAAAYGRFPTPINDLMAAAKLVVVEDHEIDENLLQRFLKQSKAGIASLKSALSKVLGLFEPKDRLVVIEKNLPAPRVPFVKLHEAGHGCLPHQSGMYALIHDCEKTLDPYTTDLFEREANVFASEVLFQGKGFATEAHDSAFSLKTAMNLAKKYGASNYATFRRYVATNPKSACLVVLEMPSYSLDGSFTAQVRRVVTSRTFNTIFDTSIMLADVNGSHFLAPVVPLYKKRMSFEKLSLKDRNSKERVCSAEAFNSTHQILILICDTGETKKFSILM